MFEKFKVGFFRLLAAIQKIPLYVRIKKYKFAEQLKGFTEETDGTAEIEGAGGTTGTAEAVMLESKGSPPKSNLSPKEEHYQPATVSTEMPQNGTINEEVLLNVLVALKKGDLTKRMPSKLTGVEGKIADALNEVIDRHELMLHKMEKVGNAVGKRGKFGKRIPTDDFSGSWESMIDSVNFLIEDLVWPTREMSRIADAVGKGDFSRKMESEKDGEPLKGEISYASKAVNTMADHLGELVTEVTRVAQQVGAKGNLGRQARVKGLSGGWEDMLENVNVMAENLTEQVRDVTMVARAITRGDFSKRISVNTPGETQGLKETMNIMVDQLEEFTSEVTQVAVQMSEGELGGQVRVKGVSGAWKNLSDKVNLMAESLTGQMRNITEVTKAISNGDLSKKVTVNAQGEVQDLKDTMNRMVNQLDTFTDEMTRVTTEVGSKGRLGSPAEVPEASGNWKRMIEEINHMSQNLTTQLQDVSKVATAIAHGNLEQKVTVDAQGEIQKIKKMLNYTVEILSVFSSEVTRVSRDVGTEGKLGGQVKVKDTFGVWEGLTEEINQMVGNLTVQLWDVSKVTRAISRGDLSKRITVDAEGEILEIKEKLNSTCGLLESFASEITRVTHAVGNEGRLGRLAEVPEASGTWKKLTENVNQMTDNLTSQLRDMSKTTRAIARGNLDQKVTANAKGEVLELKETINTIVYQQEMITTEVMRVTNEMGVKGKLGGRVEVPEVSGIWKSLIENVNQMTGNMTAQLRDISKVARAVARGDLEQKIIVEAYGEVQELKETINSTVDQLGSLTTEVTRVTREVGTKGKLGGQAEVPGVSGSWEALTDNVNQLAGNLTVQLRDVSKVASAVARGDLSKKITVDAQGEIQELKETINTMVDQLGSFASEVTRVAREVGTEGKLGGQAEVPGVSGTWEDLTENVNQLAGNLTVQLRDVSKVASAVARGDLSKKITVDAQGEIQELKETINKMVDQLGSFASEVTRVAHEVGTEGKLGGQAKVKGVSGTWQDLTENVNQLAGNLTVQLRDVSKVATAIAHGDLGQKITVDAEGEILDIKDTINTMVDQLGSFASEVTRVAREVGTEGKLGGQANVIGVSGTWKDLTENVNMMGSNLTDQVRGIAKIVTAVANGDLTKKLTVEAKGEIASLADTINNMIDTLAIFTDQVTTVAREVGTEGKLGGQAEVPGASGNWKSLTNKVNQLADNLTTQVRAIADVATAVTEGDLSRSISVEANGEVGELKNRINDMIHNLRETTHKNNEQDWLKTNLAKFSRMLQGQKDLLEVSRFLLSELAPVVSVQHAVFYGIENNEENEDGKILKLLSTYGYREQTNRFKKVKLGEGLIGQCALEKERILLKNVPEDYIQINSGLGEAPPLNVVILPVIFEGEVKAVIELASLERFSEIHLSFLDQMAESIGVVLNTIEATMRTENLLEQSQSLAGELQNRQEELQQTNGELEEKARLLVDQKVEVEAKNQEVEYARQELEEKAEQLELTSKYKSEFLANMSHELRTPLNSLLILSAQLKENKEDNLTGKQIEFIETIQSAGSDLLSLIDDILDLSKIESGTVSVNAEDEKIQNVREEVLRTFQPMAEVKKGLSFTVEIDKQAPEKVHIDRKRLLQVLKNLLSNSFKFTNKGEIKLKIDLAEDGWSYHNNILNEAGKVISFSVIDSGIGIPPEQQKIIFEAFQQADGSTSRKYGGSGLGLAISREIADLLGGELQLISSTPGQGSKFRLYIPEDYVPEEDKTVRKRSSSPKVAQKPPVTANKPVKSTSKVKEEEDSKEVPDDDRNEIDQDDQILLIIEEDKKFAERLLKAARKKGFKGLIARNGEEALVLTKDYSPHGITLDTNLEDIDGWTVLDRLKLNSQTRHIPVHIISTENDENFGLGRGAFAHLVKPVSGKDMAEALLKLETFLNEDARRLLIVEDDEKKQKNLLKLIGKGDVEITAVDSGKMALKALEKQHFDCMVLDYHLQDMSGMEVLEQIQKLDELRTLPIIIYTNKELAKKEAAELEKVAKTNIVKTTHLPERVLDETSLFMHRKISKLPKLKQEMLKKLYETDEALDGKNVLVVDDDVRNIFALTSILEQHKLEVVSAENGREAIELLNENPDVDLILMDIMMPEMDGYETMKRIRKQTKFKSMPIIALTAKAMKGDREKCLKAGASDYITKPVDTDQLLSMMRVWLYR